MRVNRPRPDWRGHKIVGLLTLCLVTAGVVFATGLAVRGRGAQGAGVEKLSVDDPRPLAEALKKLEDKYGWVITYEDPFYLHESEIVDVTESASRGRDNSGGRRLLIPKGGPLSVEYDKPADGQRPADPSQLVQQLLDAHAVKGYAGRFRLESDGRAIHVIPTAYTDRAGELVQQEPVLDAVITLPAGEHSGLQTVQAICDAVSQATGTQVVVATLPVNLFARHRDRQSRVNLKAREALESLLESVGDGQTNLSWRLLFDPDTKTYFLNIHPVPAHNG